MNKYESVVIINPSIDEEGVKTLVEKFTNLINNDGKLEKVENLGKRKYEVFYFEANPELIFELERNYRITDEVIKFMTIKVED